MNDEIRARIEAMSLPLSGRVRDALRAIEDGEAGLALLTGHDGAFAGLVTDGDIRRALLGGLGTDSPVAEVERPAPKTARVGMAAEEVAALFSEPVRVVPLLDEAGRVADLALFDSRVRLPVAEPFLGEQEWRYVSECVLTGWISSAGRFVRLFEERFAELCEVEHAVAVSNGTAALHLCLLALGVGPGDEVIVPTLTFIATANTVAYTGAEPVLVDSEPRTWNLDPELVARAITPRTKAIVPVHLYGHPADLEPLLALGREHGIAVVEDAAEAHGARYRGRPVGGLADVGAFSFYGNKIVTTGEGGMVVTNRADLAERVRLLRGHGMDPGQRYRHTVLGYNYRLTNLQAAVGVAQLEKMDAILARKAAISARYAAGLAGLPGIVLPPAAEWATNVHWLYSVLVDSEAFGLDRDALMAALDEAGVETRPFFVPVHRQPIYERGLSLPVAERLAATGLSLPSAVTLAPAEVDRVVEAVASLAAGSRPRAAQR